MKQEKILNLSLIAFNIILLALVLYMKFGSYSKGVSIKEYNKAISLLKQSNKLTKNLSQFQLFSENTKIPDTTKILNEKGEFNNLKNHITQSKLILRYSELNCQSCVDAMITQIRVNKSIDSNNMLFLAYYKQPAYLYQFKRLNRINMPIFSLQNILLPDTLNVPYFFILHPNLTVSNVFIPEEGDNESVKKYLNFMIKKMNENNL